MTDEKRLSGIGECTQTIPARVSQQLAVGYRFGGAGEVQEVRGSMN